MRQLLDPAVHFPAPIFQQSLAYTGLKHLGLQCILTPENILEMARLVQHNYTSNKQQAYER